MHLRLGLTAALLMITLAPAATAHHPGSVQGLAHFQALGVENLVHRLPDVQQAFADWETQWPDRVERRAIGLTSSGFPLEGIRITDEAIAFDEAGTATGQKLRVYLDGGHHGNEFLGVDLVMYYLRGILQKAGDGDAATQRFLQQTEVWAVPIINVDGNTLDTRKNSNLVDPNRNYDFEWGTVGASDFILDATYRGPAPGSEAEVRANMAFATEIRPDLWITAHTGVAEFYWPWGWTNEKAPDWEFFESLEGPFENATNGRVDAMQSAELYLASGATDDWGYAVLGVPTHTYEVHEDQFVPVYGDPISDVIADQLAGLDFMVRNVQHMGAWLEVSGDGGQRIIRNTGWGVARNATLGGMVLPDIPPGGELTVEAPGAATELRYRPLLVTSSKERSVAVTGAAPGPVEVAPGIAGLFMVALAFAAVARRRRA